MSDAFFSVSFSDARGRFLAACLKAGARVTSYDHPLRGPQGEALATDVAWLGDPSARRVLVVGSGTHGVEGLSGSGIQVGLLAGPDAPRPPPGTALLLVHALNPYGFAWIRRVNEDNVDLNRNFVDHAAGAWPENPGYADLADALVPRRWDAASLAASEATFAAFVRDNGEDAFRRTVKSGQHTHPDGVFYGGRAPTWSSRLVERICREHLADATHLALIDVHTGLGPYGYGETLTSVHRGTPEEARARRWYGEDLASTVAPKTAYSGSTGSIIVGCTEGAPWAEWTPIGLEFGTIAPDEVRLAVRADGWLHLYGEIDSPEGRRIKKALRDAFYPDDTVWRAKVWARGAEIVAKGLAGLAG
ncbi:MAG: M14 family metallopeptidase [Rhodospirillales bacterium]